MSKFVPVAKKSEIPNQTAKCVQVEGKSIALFNLGGRFYAIDDTCPHVGGPLSGGLIQGEEVECPWHGARFHIATGKVALNPATKDVATYNLRLNGEDIEIEV
jgi:3-phenylpropionate/trans-cinnamate dioxygenase ferredoxin component